MIGFRISFSSDGKITVEDICKTTVRENKGVSENKHVDNYCIVDLETTGVFIKCADIIEISAIKVRDNKIVGKFSTLINPLCEIPKEATDVNHITNEMVKEAPEFNDVIDDFLEFVGDDVIVGYNNASFDMNLIYDNLQNLRGIPFKNNYLDLLHAFRRSIEGLENYKLETVSKYYGFDTEGEHRGLKDCYLTKNCYDKLFKEYGDAAFRKKVIIQVEREFSTLLKLLHYRNYRNF